METQGTSWMYSGRIFDSTPYLGTQGSAIAFEDGDTLELTLDLAARTLTIKNARSGASSALASDLPAGRTYYPAASVYGGSRNPQGAVEILSCKAS